MVRLNALGKIAGRKEVENGKPVIRYINGKYQIGNYWYGEFHWTLSTLFNTWQEAFNDKVGRLGMKDNPYIQEKDGLFYSHAEMEYAYN